MVVEVLKESGRVKGRLLMVPGIVLLTHSMLTSETVDEDSPVMLAARESTFPVGPGSSVRD